MTTYYIITSRDAKESWPSLRQTLRDEIDERIARARRIFNMRQRSDKQQEAHDIRIAAMEEVRDAILHNDTNLATEAEYRAMCVLGLPAFEEHDITRRSPHSP